MTNFKLSIGRIIEREYSLILEPLWWKCLYWDIRAFFNPRQKWLTKKIPNSWQDKDELIRICLFEILINYVEDELDGAKNLTKDWSEDLKKGYVSQGYVDNSNKTDKKILDMYNYIKFDRPKLEEKMWAAYPDFYFKDLKSESYGWKEHNEKYGEVDKLEKEIDKKDNWAMIEIVKMRGYLWT